MQKTTRSIILLSVLVGSPLGACDEPSDGNQSAADLAIDEPLAAQEDGIQDTSSPVSAPTRRFVPGEIIVKFREADDGRRAGLTLAGVRIRAREQLVDGAELWEIEAEPGPAAAPPDEDDRRTLAAIDALRGRLDVEYAHENLYLHYFAVPNDSLYSKQWNFPAVKLPAAWDRVSSGVKVAVLDSGRVEHPDLVGRWGEGYDATYSDSDPKDDSTWHHGVHVAGILGARTNNGAGVAGATWSGQILPVRVGTNEGTIALSAVGNAITWSVGRGARVINMSFGSLPGSSCVNYPYIQNAINLATQQKVVLVAAAGNSNGNTATVVPAGCTGVVAVGASTSAGLRAPWSNKGTRVDIMAPGGTSSSDPNALYGAGIGCSGETNPYDPYAGTDGVFSTWAVGKPASSLSGSNYCYRYLSGTSMAAPHVAAAAALMLSLSPSMTPAQVLSRLKSTAKAISGCTNDCGSGLLDTAAALPVMAPMCGPCGSGKDCHCGDVCRPIGSICP